ncbi:MAG: hypothetical protein ACXWW8_02870 [Solirubrobacterales bacterium]
MIKPYRLFRERVSDLAGDANAYLRRRRQERKPFARIYYEDGRSTGVAAETEAGRALFLAASHLVEAAGPPRTRRQQRRAAAADE